jgi:serine/threonine protein kinase
MDGRIGPYEILERIGAGGMAETFVGLRRGPGGFEQRVCIKRILPTFEQDRAFVQQFLEEARVSARLRHANIVQVLDFGVCDGAHYLALELVEGMDLHRLLAVLRRRGETLTSGLVAFLAVELATALEYAHTHPEGALLHRDISPSNVLLSRVGEVKLSDFGIARAVTRRAGGPPKTETGTIRGKVPYMAAEYALHGVFDPRSDLFALGVTLYESLAGRRPFVGATDLDTLQRIVNGVHPPLSELCPSAPSELVAAIERLIRTNPEERHPSATAFLDALVDVPPPPTARRILGDLVRRAAEWEREGSSEPIEAIEGTAMISDAARLGPDPGPVPAPPDAPTRTHLAPDFASTEVVDDPPQFATALDVRAPSVPSASAAAAVEATAVERPSVHPAALPDVPSASAAAPAGAWGVPASAFAQAWAAHASASPVETGRPSQTPFQVESRPRTARVASRAPWAAVVGALALAALGGLGWMIAGGALSAPAEQNPPALPTAHANAASGMASAPTGAPPPRSQAPMSPPPAGRPPETPAPKIPPTEGSPPEVRPPETQPPASQPAEAAPRAPAPTEAAPRAPALTEGAAELRGVDPPPQIVADDSHPERNPRRLSRRLAPPEGATARSASEFGERRPDPPRPDSPRSASLLVVVSPWGDVWIDGRFVGRAPQRVSLAPGRHNVAVGHGAPAVRREVVLRAGEQHALDLELSGE